VKLKSKFLLPALALIVAGMAVTTLVTYQRSTASLSARAVENASSTLTGLHGSIELWVEGARNEIMTIAKTSDIIEAVAQSPSDAALTARALALLVDSSARHATFDSIMIVDAQGIVLTGSNPKLIGVDLGKREYYQRTMAGEDFISSPIFSVDSGAAVFVITSPIRSQGKIIGVIASGIKINYFSEQFIKPLDTPIGYAFILAPDGLILAHPDGKLVGKTNIFTEMDYGKEIARTQSGSLDTVSLGIEKLIIYEKSKQTGWTIGMAVNKKAAFADARHLGLLILGLSAGQVVVLIAGIWIILSINVLRPTSALVASASRISEGDLDTALETDRTDEIGSLQRALSKMVGNLKIKIREAEDKEHLAAQETAKANAAMQEAEQARRRAELARKEGMLQAAGQLENIVEAVTNATESISGQIAQSSRGSQEQSERMTETATAMEEMNATVMEVAKNAAMAADTADSAKKNAGDGSSVVSKVIKSIGDAQTKALDLKKDMNQLGEQVQSIGEIMNVISDIADQTNLLALNAAIEAARAGEAGRGFAVVADEVRKLAEKTMIATKQVGEAIVGIQQGTRKNLGNVDQAVQRIDEATALAGRSGEALAAIVELVDQTTDQVRSIATASEQQSAATEEINRSVAQVSEISSTMATVLKQSAHSLSGLADQARSLRNLIDAMKTGNDERMS